MVYLTLDDILSIRDQVSVAYADRFEVMSPNGLMSALAAPRRCSGYFSYATARRSPRAIRQLSRLRSRSPAACYGMAVSPRGSVIVSRIKRKQDFTHYGGVLMSKKWVYLFSEGNASMRDMLGGKGAGVAEMTRTGVPVPPGFTITTEASNAYYDSGKQFPEGLWEQVTESLKDIEQKTGKKFGDPSNPLLVSVRSGAKLSMPGM